MGGQWGLLTPSKIFIIHVNYCPVYAMKIESNDVLSFYL